MYEIEHPNQDTLRMKGGIINNYYRTIGINFFFSPLESNGSLLDPLVRVTNEFVIVNVFTGLVLLMFKPRGLQKHCTHVRYSSQWIAS